MDKIKRHGSALSEVIDSFYHGLRDCGVQGDITVTLHWHDFYDLALQNACSRYDYISTEGEMFSLRGIVFRPDFIVKPRAPSYDLQADGIYR